MADTITRDEVAEYLGILPLSSDARLTKATDGAIKWVEKRRSLTEPDVMWAEEDVRLGAIQFAGLLYMQRVQPQGFAGMDDAGNYSEDVGQMMVQIYRLVGNDPVVA